jgi:hypothetical protein
MNHARTWPCGSAPSGESLNTSGEALLSASNVTAAEGAFDAAFESRT